MTLTLPEDQIGQIEEALRSGRFRSADDLVSEALARMLAPEATTPALDDDLLTAYRDGIASGDERRIDPAQFLAGLNAEFRRRG